jgi:hypothetical protein
MNNLQWLRTRIGIVTVGVVCTAVVIGVIVGAKHWAAPAASTSLPKETTSSNASPQLMVSQPVTAVPNAVDPNGGGLNTTGNPQPSATTAGGTGSAGSASVSSTSSTVPPVPSPTPNPTRPCGCYGTGGHLCPLSAGSAQPQIMCYPCGYAPSASSDALACPIE